MKTAISHPRFTAVLFGAILASAVLLVGCDRDEEAPPPTDVPQQGLTDEAGRGAALGDEPAAAPGENNDVPGALTPPSSDTLDIVVADIKPTQNHEANGIVTFMPAEDGTRTNIHIELAGLSPGSHGLHIHEHGDCSAPDAMSAGDHHNPFHAPHGSPQEPPHHLGDLGNVEADANGRVNTTVTAVEIALSGPASVLDKAVVVHAQPDDLQTQPSGNSGDRIGCGVIRRNPDALAGSAPDNALMPQ